jgi:hypothetical protein
MQGSGFHILKKGFFAGIRDRNGAEIQYYQIRDKLNTQCVKGTLKNPVPLANKPTACRAKRQPAMNAKGRE